MIANLTHYDLDGIVCHIILKNITPDVRYYCCGYGKIEKKINEIIRDKNIYGFKKVIVTDLAINIELSQMLKKQFDKLYLFDHHETTFLNKEELQKIYKIFFTIENSASKLLFDTYKQKFSNIQPLEKLVYLTDIYDTWQVNNKDFWEAYALNTMFWELKWDRFFETYFERYIPLSPADMKYVENIYERKKNIVESCEQISFNNVCLMIMGKNANEVTNEVTMIKPEYRYYFIFTPNENKLSIRIRNSDSNLSKVFDKIKTMKIITDCGAHPFAGGITLAKEYTKDEFENLINTIYEKLEEIKNDKN